MKIDQLVLIFLTGPINWATACFIFYFKLNRIAVNDVAGFESGCFPSFDSFVKSITMSFNCICSFMMKKWWKKSRKKAIFDIFMPISVDLCEWKNFKAFFHLFFSLKKSYFLCWTRFITPKALHRRWFLIFSLPLYECDSTWCEYLFWHFFFFFFFFFHWYRTFYVRYSTLTVPKPSKTDIEFELNKWKNNFIYLKLIWFRLFVC